MLRKLPLVLVLFTFIFIIFTQVSIVNAFHIPITSPLTTPITSPITSANVVGKVVYKHLGRLFGNANRIIPIQGVVISIQNFFNKNQKYSTKTDINGVYGIQVPDGTYLLKLNDGHNTFFTPPLKIIRIKNNQNRADFQGLIFTSTQR